MSKKSKLLRVDDAKDIVVNGVTIVSVIKPEESQGFEKLEEIEDLPDDFNKEALPPVQKNEIEELREMIQELRNENQKISFELKAAKGKKILNLEEAEIIFKRKTELIRNLKTFEKTLRELNEVDRISPSEDDPIQTDYYRISFERKAGSRNETIFQTSNILVITEAISVVKNSIIQKMENLKEEISTIDF